MLFAKRLCPSTRNTVCTSFLYDFILLKKVKMVIFLLYVNVLLYIFFIRNLFKGSVFGQNLVFIELTNYLSYNHIYVFTSFL